MWGIFDIVTKTCTVTKKISVKFRTAKHHIPVEEDGFTKMNSVVHYAIVTKLGMHFIVF